MQNEFIYTDTVARNIAPGAKRIEAEILLHALQVANIHEFIDHLPMGIPTKIGAEEFGLSQGQKQRILIARATQLQPYKKTN